ncbi:formate/nitrite transporter family protein [Bradyrhizobium sp. ma5]|uniref:formate/nitrite transporter family protein n=1 Tax=Bradyrhizobium sp. ma5 TaxID=3344828 RepID=UPI0035D46E0E
MAGTLAAAAFFALKPVLSPELRSGMMAVAGHIVDQSLSETVFRAISAGFLMAMMVWLLPSAKAAQFHVIVLITSLISAAQFTHIVAGSVEAFLPVITGHLGLWPMLMEFFIPVLIGNKDGRRVVDPYGSDCSDDRDAFSRAADIADQIASKDSSLIGQKIAVVNFEGHQLGEIVIERRRK